MNLSLKRHPSGLTATLGELFIGDRFECFTLEDVVREVPDKPVSEWKIGGKTAIPKGRYAVVVSDSRRFHRPLPLLVNVPGFSGVRVHPGNTSEDTEGCILVGSQIAGEAIMESRKAFEELYVKILDAFDSGDLVHITVGNA